MTKATRSRADAEFFQATKEKLAERAGYRCSFPGCRAVTIGPSAEGPDRSASTGMACHIRTAATGPSARRVSNASPQTLKQISNGIWMCYRHGKLIDADETTYRLSAHSQNKPPPLTGVMARRKGGSGGATSSRRHAEPQ